MLDESFLISFVVLMFLALCLLYAVGKLDGYAKAHRELIDEWNRLTQGNPDD